MRINCLLLSLLLGACTTMAPPDIHRTPLPVLDNTWYLEARADLQAALKRSVPARAQNVILFVGDGMSLATVTAARIRQGQLAGNSGEENRLSFEQFPYVALAKTYNTNAQVPDSAGTATAMLSGVKTQIGVVGVDDRVRRGDCTSVAGSSVPSLLEHAEDAGMATGVVTTTRITHATPAAAFAHVAERGWESLATPDCPGIAAQLIAFTHGDTPEVVMGGGRSNFMPLNTADPEYPDRSGRRDDGRDLISEWQQRHGDRAAYVWNKGQFDGLDLSRHDRVLALFEPSHMQYEADRDDSAAGEPSLSDMVTTAVKMLQKSERGFFLLVEGGRIDHAHHGSNAYRALHDTIAMADAVAAARNLTSADDTLIVVTADHGHVMEIAGYPYRGNPILGKVVSIAADGGKSAEYARDASGKPYTTLVYGNGPGHVAPSDKQPEGVKKHPHSGSQHGAITGGRPDLTTVDTEHLDYLQESAVPLSYETHSGTDVAIYADGPGAWLFQGVHEQHYIFHVMAYALFGHN
ncbi:MAG: alkaline phosphatase [Gammaproteobacteria bacterium]|nr:alkaline phosphatase [Gammaproteobacteria bacterium]NNF61343.1 alkaline phosphatase [Gammaproteobacteria bacterium]